MSITFNRKLVIQCGHVFDHVVKVTNYTRTHYIELCKLINSLDVVDVFKDSSGWGYIEIFCRNTDWFLTIKLQLQFIKLFAISWTAAVPT